MKKTFASRFHKNVKNGFSRIRLQKDDLIQFEGGLILESEARIPRTVRFLHFSEAKGVLGMIRDHSTLGEVSLCV